MTPTEAVIFDWGGMRGVLRPNPASAPFEVVPAATIERLSDLLGHIDRWSAHDA